MRPTARQIAPAVFIAGIVMLLIIVFRPAPVRVDVARVQRGALQVTVDEEGRTRVRDRFVITAPIAGRVARLAIETGDVVEQGAVVAHMNPLPLDPRMLTEAQARLDAAEATRREADARVAQARATLEQAQRSGARARELGKMGTIGREERELADLAETARRRELEAAEFAARAAEFNVEAARAVLLAPGSESAQAFVAACEAQDGACLELRAPISGRVLRLPEKSERVVAAGMPLLELGDPTALEIVVDILSADAVKVKPGAPMLVENWGGDQPLQARVRLVEPSGFTKLSALGVEEQRVNVIGDFVSPPVPLADGYRIEARIVVWQTDEALKLPASALFRRAGAWNVFVIDGGRAQHRSVEIGQRGTTEVQILNGLTEGAEVVLHPSDQVEDGVRVTPL